MYRRRKNLLTKMAPRKVLQRRRGRRRRRRSIRHAAS